MERQNSTIVGVVLMSLMISCGSALIAGGLLGVIVAIGVFFVTIPTSFLLLAWFLFT